MGFTHVEGIRVNGAMKYFKSWIPDVPKAMYPLIVPLEILGQFMRLISLSVRLYANMLAGHMLILTFIGLIFVLGNLSLAVVAVPAAAAFYLFEVVIVVSIQAYIFAALLPSTSARPSSRSTKEETHTQLFLTVPRRRRQRRRRRQGHRARARHRPRLARRRRRIGNIFGSMIQAVARQPELRGELQGIQWLGFALTEAVVFYGLIGGLLAYVLV